ncbi:hypothetical protein CJF30_00010920 [Rutstroemia sp. NJR-2017a BBW]|nr:hypothetical protein CJF30_00010920 [Rutstroemia sp. NJR-2017a BBW]
MADSTSIPPDYNRGPQILAICGSLVALTLIVGFLRLYVRIRIIREVGVDDYLMMGAMMMVIIPEVHLGAGRHVQYIIPASNVTRGLHLNFVTQPLCVIGLCLAKLSIGFFLLRLALAKKYKFFIYGVLIFTGLSATGNLCIDCFLSMPPAQIRMGHVHISLSSTLLDSPLTNSPLGVSVLTDLIFALLPVPMIWGVQLKWRVKIGVYCILSLGIFATAAAFVKISFLATYGQHGDFLYDSSDLTIWTTVEICTAMIAACIPPLKHLIKSVFTGSSNGYSSKQYGTGGAYHRNESNGPDRMGWSQRSQRRNTRQDDLEFDVFGPQKDATAEDIKSTTEEDLSVKPDNTSQESILPHQSPTGIMKTTQVHVSSHEYRS